MLRIRDLHGDVLLDLSHRYEMQLERVPSDTAIPGSYWGECEAGLIGSQLFVRDDTPVHSALHEASHFICMDEARRSHLHRDAGGDHAEENAVCYLQIILAKHVTPMNGARMQADMDAWGYTFRLGSARAWFEYDADDARAWLSSHGLIDAQSEVTWRLRR